MSSPKEILSKHIMKIKDIRIPYGRIVVENILEDLKDHGYVIMEKSALDAAFKSGVVQK